MRSSILDQRLYERVVMLCAVRDFPVRRILSLVGIDLPAAGGVPAAVDLSAGQLLMVAHHLDVTLRQLTDSIADQPQLPAGSASSVTPDVINTAIALMRLRPEQRSQVMDVVAKAAEAA